MSRKEGLTPKQLESVGRLWDYGVGKTSSRLLFTEARKGTTIISALETNGKLTPEEVKLGAELVKRFREIKATPPR